MHNVEKEIEIEESRAYESKRKYDVIKNTTSATRSHL